jgi:hypothetical protein
MDSVEEPPWTADLVLEGLTDFYRSLAGRALMFPWADRPVAVDLHGTAFAAAKTDLVLEAVETLSGRCDLADHLFRECWARAHPETALAGDIYWVESQTDRGRKVDVAAQMVADRHNSRFISPPQVDVVKLPGSDAPHGRPSDVAVIAPAA